MKTRPTQILLVIGMFVGAVFTLGGCTTPKGYLPHIPKDVEITGFKMQTSTPWGGTVNIEAESYKSAGFQVEPDTGL